MALNVGRIPFLVCAPFFYKFLDKESDFPQIKFEDAPPSLQCKGLLEGRIHLSPASSIVFAQKKGAFILSPELCTSCSFEVRSVKLFSNFPIEELSQKNVRLTSQSQTSVALLKILLQERFGVKPYYLNGLKADPTDDACLLIGDLALEENSYHRFKYHYDLGTLWRDWQNLPFVFGAWVIEKSALQQPLKPILYRYLDDTKKSIEDFRKNPSVALDRWLTKYPVHLEKNIILDYYKILDYHFTEERKESLKIFFDYAYKYGFIQKVSSLEFL